MNRESRAGGQAIPWFMIPMPTWRAIERKRWPASMPMMIANETANTRTVPNTRGW